MAASCSDGRDMATGEAAGAGADAAPSAGEAAEFDFARPTAVAQLPEPLAEISGIASIGGGQVVAVQDEAGVIYTVEVSTGRVLEERTFAGKGDYEDLALVEEGIYVLRSDGTLFELKEWWREGRAEVEEYETGLKSRCDAEGLAHDAAQRRLLVACKEEPKGVKQARAVYAFDLETNVLQPEPVYLIPFSDLEGIAGPDAKAKDFKPSAIAVHPASQELYVLSSVLRSVLVLDAEGRPKSFYRLDEDLYPQPEGLTFVEGGGLLVSNEAAGGTATLLQFR